MNYDRPPHGGYPTPTYDEAPARRRAESMRIFGHTGASVYGSALETMRRAAAGRSALLAAPKAPREIENERYERQEHEEIMDMTPEERAQRGFAIPGMTVGDVLRHKES